MCVCVGIYGCLLQRFRVESLCLWAIEGFGGKVGQKDFFLAARFEVVSCSTVLAVKAN